MTVVFWWNHHTWPDQNTRMSDGGHDKCLFFMTITEGQDCLFVSQVFTSRGYYERLYHVFMSLHKHTICLSRWSHKCLLHMSLYHVFMSPRKQHHLYFAVPFFYSCSTNMYIIMFFPSAPVFFRFINEIAMTIKWTGTLFAGYKLPDCNTDMNLYAVPVSGPENMVGSPFNCYRCKYAPSDMLGIIMSVLNVTTI